MLNWHKKKEGWVAWAVKAFPQDAFPPRYTLIVATPRSSRRRVELKRYGLPATEVGVADNLEDAKELAESDYAKHLTTASKRVDSSTQAKME